MIWIALYLAVGLACALVLRLTGEVGADEENPATSRPWWYSPGGVLLLAALLWPLVVALVVRCEAEAAYRRWWIRH